MITGTLNEIVIGGLSSTPSDYDCQDGEMMVCHNMAGGKGVAKASTVKVGEGEDAQELPEIGADAELVFVHNTSFGKVYITKDEYDTHSTAGTYYRLYFYKEGMKEWKYLYRFSEKQEPSISAVGNLLIVNDKGTGLNYIRYKNDEERYKDLGTQLPDLDIRFALEEAPRKPEGSNLGLNDNVTFYNKGSVMQCSYDDFTSHKKWEDGEFDDAVYGVYNELQNRIRKIGCFAKPFLVRYALKMYDGNYIMHSSPVLMCPSDFNAMQMFVIHGDASNTGYAQFDKQHVSFAIHSNNFYVGVLYYCTKLVWKVEGLDELEDWKDIIQEVSVFVTPDISSYSSSGTLSYTPFWTHALPHEFKDTTYLRSGKQGSSNTLSSDSTPDLAAKVIKFPKREGTAKEWVEEASQNFRMLASFTLDELREHKTEWDEVKANVNLNNLNVKEQLTDGYRIRTNILPNFMHTYNSRLNIANVMLKEITAFPEGYVSGFIEGNNGVTGASVYIEEDGVWQETETTRMLGWATPTELAGFFYYPNPNAKYLELSTSGGESTWVKLTPHPFLNGAYYLNEELTGFVGIETLPDITVTEEGVPRPNYIYTSEVDNPFLFPALGVNQIGSGKITAIKSATQAMSEGTAFGAQPLYVFTEDGIYAMQVNGVGLYDRAAPLSRETIKDASKALSIDNSILFLNERGLMQLTGSQTKCLSLPLTDKWSSVDLGELKNWELIMQNAECRMQNFGEASGFKDFIKNARLAFDYVNYRVYVYADGVGYAYVYDLGMKQWSTCDSAMVSSVEGYPATLINMRETDSVGNVVTRICQFSDDDSELVDGGNVVWLTRPMKFGEHDILKTVRRVMMRGRFSNKDSLKLALWGSRNMEDWVYIGGVKNGTQIARLSGTPYKYFLVGGAARMSKEDMLSRLTMEKQERYVNKPR